MSVYTGAQRAPREPLAHVLRRATKAGRDWLFTQRVSVLSVAGYGLISFAAGMVYLAAGIALAGVACVLLSVQSE